MSDIDARLYNTDLFGSPMRPPVESVVARNFGVPPFSVLNAREGLWQDRKRAWVALGIKGEVGRSAKSYNIHEWMDDVGEDQRASGDGTSIFDPVLCELVYEWFSPPAGLVLDPFAGGSVRGVVASCLGRRYWGCDLRAEQIETNREQATIGTPDSITYVCGDSLEELPAAPEADLVFSCPPYGDLERYSDDPRDLSAKEWHTFTAAYKHIVLRACKRLRNDRFACFVVGDFRAPDGSYRNFVGETVTAFLNAGLKLYNEAILVTSVGSASMRVTKQFTASRKLAKTHQNVLVFVKGDPRRATAACSVLTSGSEEE